MQLDLRPVLALKARVALIRDVPKGEYTGYGRAFQTKRDSRIANLPIGYADGLPRSLSDGRAYVRIGEFTAPMLGASVWTSLRWILPMHLGLLSEILLRWSLTGKTAGFLPLVLQSKQEASAMSC